jgi:hypothetical protein
MKKIFLLPVFLLFAVCANATQILIPMDQLQTNHLRAYGVAFNVLARGGNAQWLLNYRGGSFLVSYSKEDETACTDKNILFEVLPEAKVKAIMKEISKTENNMSAVQMERAPKIAVHAAPGVEVWDDPVSLVLQYAGISFDVIHDEDILQGRLSEYDWIHNHHDDFTGQYGRFYTQFSKTPWYMNEVFSAEAVAKQFGFQKVSQMKLAVAKQIRNFVSNGGFLFAMCSATDSYDIALAADGVDICDKMYDGDAADAAMNTKLNYENCFAFQNFQLKTNSVEYEFSNIDTYGTRTLGGINEKNDYFNLTDYSVLTNKEATMLTQNHVRRIKGCWGQTTGFNAEFIKPGVDIMGATVMPKINEARYIHGKMEKGMWTFYGGHDPEDYQHRVEEPVTNVSLFPNSPGYRLILNNVLFPSTMEKENSSVTFRSYPNPASDQMTIEADGSIENAVLSIYDINGKQVLTQNFSSGGKIVIDISALSPGNYLWKIDNGAAILHAEKFSVVR